MEEDRVPDQAGERPGSKLSVWLVRGGFGLAILAGVWLRISTYGRSLVGDELSTLWIVQNHGLAGTVDFVSGDGEISPPLFFIFAWLATKLGSSPELIRLPSLLAGFLSLPLFYLLGTRLFDRRAGIAATAIASISPILVYFSANGRAYSVAIFLLLASTVAMLAAVDTGRKRWWLVYALASAAAMYTHYTVAFVLAFQLGWLVWCFPKARVPALVANAGATLLFLPWLPGFLSDSNSPTTPILEALQGYGFEAKRTAVEQLLFWEVDAGKWSMDGRWDAALIVAGTLLALTVVLVKAGRTPGFGKWLRRIDRNLVLVIGLVLVTPVGALILGTFSTDIFGGRNLGASWTGIPLLLGALLTAAGPIWGLISLALVSVGLLAGSIHLADRERTEFRYRDAAEFIDARANPGDTVVDSSHITPVPLTPLDAYLGFEGREYRIGLPEGDPPFLPGATVPDTAKQLKDAFRGADRVYIVTLVGQESLVEDGALSFGNEKFDLPAGAKVVQQKTFDGIYPVTVTVIDPADPANPKKAE
ncbi:MAG: glycosyltransferase family 39 protein [Solirubrobacterales bacterium]|nr:glycosyltransferase family 39 protein [Solirubrobacterales bacterium]